MTAATCSKRRATVNIPSRPCSWINRPSCSRRARASWATILFLRRAQLLSQPYHDRASCTYCGFCQAFGCHVGAKSSILVTKLPEADATGNFKLLTGATCYHVNTDNSGRATGVSYYGPDGSDNTIEAEIVILAPFIYDNTRLLLISKTEQISKRAGQFQRPVGQARHGSHQAESVRRVTTTASSTSTWGRARRSTASTISTPTISTTAAWASFAARRFRSVPPTWKPARSAPPSA